MKPGAAAFFAFILALCVGSWLWGLLDEPNLPLHCKDQWDSASIGAQGACSHHGGVAGGEDPTPWWKKALALAGGMLSFGLFAYLLQLIPTPKSDPYAAWQDPVSLVVRDAMKHGKDVRFVYTKDSKESETRNVTPLELIFLRPGVYTSRCLVGYCHGRSAKRTFALTRISGIDPIDPIR